MSYFEIPLLLTVALYLVMLTKTTEMYGPIKEHENCKKNFFPKHIYNKGKYCIPCGPGEENPHPETSNHCIKTEPPERENQENKGVNEPEVDFDAANLHVELKDRQPGPARDQHEAEIDIAKPTPYAEPENKRAEEKDDDEPEAGQHKVELEITSKEKSSSEVKTTKETPWTDQKPAGENVPEVPETKEDKREVTKKAKQGKKSKNGMSDRALLIIVPVSLLAIWIFGMYKTCQSRRQYSQWV